MLVEQIKYPVLNTACLLQKLQRHSHYSKLLYICGTTYMYGDIEKSLITISDTHKTMVCSGKSAIIF